MVIYQTRVYVFSLTYYSIGAKNMPQEAASVTVLGHSPKAGEGSWDQKGVTILAPQQKVTQAMASAITIWQIDEV